MCPGENLSNLNVAKADMSFSGETRDRLAKPTTPSQSVAVGSLPCPFLHWPENGANGRFPSRDLARHQQIRIDRLCATARGAADERAAAPDLVDFFRQRRCADRGIPKPPPCSADHISPRGPARAHAAAVGELLPRYCRCFRQERVPHNRANNNRSSIVFG